MNLTKEQYEAMNWVECLAACDLFKMELHTPHRLRPTWEEVVKFDLLKKDNAIQLPKGSTIIGFTIN